MNQNDETAFKALFAICMEDSQVARNALNILLTARALEFCPIIVMVPAIHDETNEIDGLMLSINLKRAAEDPKIQTLAITLIEYFLKEAPIKKIPTQYIDALRQKLTSLKNSKPAQQEENFRIVQ
jgi:hypothetical protein